MASDLHLWEISDFTGGLVDKVDDNELPENAASKCQNVFSKTIGSLQSVNGQAKLNSTDLGGAVQGLHSYYQGNARKLMAAANGAVSYWDGTAFQSIKTGLSTTAMIDFETLINYVVAFNGVDAPWKWDGTNVTALANAPADGQFAVSHKEKLFTVPLSAPSTIRWSDSFAPETWPEVNYWDVKKGDGDKITTMIPHLGVLTIFKGYSIHSLGGTSIDDFHLNKIEPNVGAVGPRAVVSEGMYLYFIGSEGIYVYNGAKATNLTALKIPLLWEAVNQQYISKSVAGRWNGLLWFAVPVGTSTYPNLVLMYDPVMQSWWPRKGINPSCFVEFNNGTTVKYYAGSAMSGFVLEQDTGYSDAGVAIESFWEGKAFDPGGADYYKKAKKIFVMDGPGTNDADIYVSLDYGDMELLEGITNDNLVRKLRPPSIKWRYIKPRVYHKVIDKGFEIRGLKAYYKKKRKPK